MRRSLVLLGAAVTALVVLAVTGVVLVSSGNGKDEVASIDGHPVTRDELLFHMRRLAPTVRNEVRNGRLRGPVTEHLAARALDEIERDKALFILAGEQGLAVSIDHQAFLDDLAEENQRRTDAIAAGETVYGVTEFSAEEYYSHRLAEIRTALKARLRVDDAEVRRAFDADREAWSANATTYTYSKLVVPVPAGALANYADRLHKRVTAAGHLADVAEREPGAKLTTDTFDGSAPTGMNAHTQDLIAVLGNLDKGEISAPVPGPGQITYYELDDKAVDENAAFAEYANRIRLSLVDEKLDQLLKRRVGTSDFKVDAAAVQAINAEDVER